MSSPVPQNAQDVTDELVLAWLDRFCSDARQLSKEYNTEFLEEGFEDPRLNAVDTAFFDFLQSQNMNASVGCRIYDAFLSRLVKLCHEHRRRKLTPLCDASS